MPCYLGQKILLAKKLGFVVLEYYYGEKLEIFFCGKLVRVGLFFFAGIIFQNPILGASNSLIGTFLLTSVFLQFFVCLGYFF